MTGEGNQLGVSGIAGLDGGNIESCYNIGTIKLISINSINYPRVGGICGFAGALSNIACCYNTGDVYFEGNYTGAVRKGGIVGFLDCRPGVSASVINSFFYETDNCKIGCGEVYGREENENEGWEKCTDLNMVLTELGSNFVKNEQNINDNEYPILYWQSKE